MKPYAVRVFCLAVVLLIPVAAMAQDQPDNQDADTSASDAIIQSMQSKNGKRDFSNAFEEIVRRCVEVYSSVTSSKEAADALKLVLDAGKDLEQTATTDIVYDNDAVAKIQIWTQEQQQFLSKLSSKSSYDWQLESGFNAQYPPTVPGALDFLDGWIQKMTDLQKTVSDGLSAVPAVKKVVTVEATADFSHGDQLTPVAVAPLGVDDIRSALSSSDRSIGIILERLREARDMVARFTNVPLPTSTQSTQPPATDANNANQGPRSNGQSVQWPSVCGLLTGQYQQTCISTCNQNPTFCNGSGGGSKNSFPAPSTSNSSVQNKSKTNSGCKVGADGNGRCP